MYLSQQEKQLFRRRRRIPISRARYYDPQIGRFISEDPLGFDGGDVNLYVYAGNNPVLNSDPTGQFIFSGTAATYLFVIAPVAARYGPAIARAAQSGYARLAPAVSKAGRALMNFSRRHPRFVQGLNEAIPSSLPSTSPDPTVGGAIGFFLGNKYREHQYSSGSSSNTTPQSIGTASQNSSYTSSYTGTGGK
jgi:RHS repeat-associated protein